ncbi:hypothetical protein [Andreprevotia chitinilytica]|uniref:hypothetical protein n=1 Tax=Andreprevotia chitinilytica TaxID=396808 RepID=UPI0014702A98|nr:hypothetical protein [Andreprevotia chitinilytica]
MLKKSALLILSLLYVTPCLAADHESVDGWLQVTSSEIGLFYNQCGVPDRKIYGADKLTCLQSKFGQKMTELNLGKFNYQITMLKNGDAEYEAKTLQDWTKECYRYRAKNNADGGLAIETGCQAFMEARMTVLKTQAQAQVKADAEAEAKLAVAADSTQ